MSFTQSTDFLLAVYLKIHWEKVAQIEQEGSDFLFPSFFSF